jgi:hypothetical protein
MSEPLRLQVRSVCIALFASLIVVSAASFICLEPRPALAACSALPTALGTATLSMTIPSSGSYRVWVRELAPSSIASSFYLQVPDAGLCQIIMGSGPIPANTWTWVDFRDGDTTSVVTARLGSGNHQIQTAGRSGGVELDKILLVADTTCTPIGDGTNCAQTSATSTPPTAGSGVAGAGQAASTTVVSLNGSTVTGPPVIVSGKINITPSDLPTNVTDIQYFVDGKRVASGEIDTTKLPNGSHTVEVKATTSDGKTIVQERTITVRNALTQLGMIRAFLAAHRTVVTALGVLILVIPLGWLVLSRSGLLRRGDRPATHLSSDVAASTALTSNTAPSSDSLGRTSDSDGPE